MIFPARGDFFGGNGVEDGGGCCELQAVSYEP
jgi:hypothetical protein